MTEWKKRSWANNKQPPYIECFAVCHCADKRIRQSYDDTFDNSAHLMTLKMQLNWITQRDIEYGYVLCFNERSLLSAYANIF